MGSHNELKVCPSGLFKLSWPLEVESKGVEGYQNVRGDDEILSFSEMKEVGYNECMDGKICVIGLLRWMQWGFQWTKYR